MRKNCSDARALVGLAALTALSCATLTVQQEHSLGPQFAGSVRREYTFIDDRIVAGYVRSIGAEILEAAGPQPFEYHFYVVEHDDINAFAGPAGYIYLHTGTILAARNASELAGVIAHEIGHVARRHVAKNYGRQRGASLGRNVLAAAASVVAGSAAGLAADLGGSMAAMAYVNSFGREAEKEADEFAVEVLPRAGYDPDGMVTFFETLQHRGGTRRASFLSSHPTTSDRIEHTREQIAELPPRPGLRVDDGGRLEIIQRRIRILTGSGAASPGRRWNPDPLPTQEYAS